MGAQLATLCPGPPQTVPSTGRSRSSWWTTCGPLLPPRSEVPGRPHTCLGQAQHRERPAGLRSLRSHTGPPSAQDPRPQTPPRSEVPEDGDRDGKPGGDGPVLGAPSMCLDVVRGSLNRHPAGPRRPLQLQMPPSPAREPPCFLAHRQPHPPLPGGCCFLPRIKGAPFPKPQNQDSPAWLGKAPPHHPNWHANPRNSTSPCPAPSSAPWAVQHPRGADHQ